MNRRGIFWIASYPKSGNTWVRCLITSLQAQGAPVKLHGLGKALPNAAVRTWLEAYVDVASEDLNPDELRAMRLQAYQLYAKQHCGMLKVHDRYDAALFPADASLGTVYIVRDPRDIAPSWADHMGVDVETAIVRMADAEFTVGRGFSAFTLQAPQHLASWSEHVRSWLDDAPGPLLLLHYEALLTEPLREAARLAEFLGLPADSGCVARAVSACNFQTLRSMEEEHGFIERRAVQQRFFRQGRAGAWRGTLQPDQAERLAEQHGTIMQRLGYASDRAPIDNLQAR
ncbi:sulfotransferase domain-containing protein [Acidovorax sp. BLS4]|uniref:sulfotransferase domain-containing protein n=1 Tax=Acidovorax sp. BLS4 TaxID=3273430 RepID=UPI002942EB1D|nr:sulfotransferase domain-containing protein [Paracidovorax avenae]WOI44154.1 sulfotransferase domain-containing protein [Paracidovorax avenae]